MEITAAMVKQLREKTGVGLMDCKKALKESDGDIEKAIKTLREQGLAKAAKKSTRAANEGSITSYIHPGSKLGVLLEVNCETDFVARTDDFINLCKDIAMQCAAANPLVVKREELSQEMVEKEKEIYKTQALNEGKPEKIVDKIITGKIEKYFSEVTLLEQSFVKDQDKTIQDVINEAIAKLGENIQIKRFARFRLGE
ncbi:MAG: translation elongation factor Ts [candidate division Zixibacteria bacterium]|nr:translation elongation factor Ts [candidate division Zixibacteria bacterium]